MEKLKKHIVHENEKKSKLFILKMKNKISKPLVYKKLEKIDLQNIHSTHMISKNIKNSRSNMSKYLNLDTNFNTNIFVTANKKNTFEIDRIYFSTINDNWIKLNWSEFGDDTWKTFWFNIWSDLNIWNDKYNIDFNINHYTAWEKFSYDAKWVRNWAETNFDDSTRIDQLDLWFKKEVYLDKKNDWSYVSANIWLWAQAIWDFWIEKIQKEWHKMTNVYKHKAKYEKVNWFWLDLRADINSKKYLLWQEKKWMYLKWNLNTKIALNNKYWETNINWNIWIWTEFWGVNVEIWYKWEYIYWPRGSTTIKGSVFNNDLVSWKYIELWTKIPFFDKTIFKYKYENNEKWNDYMEIWLEYNF